MESKLTTVARCAPEMEEGDRALAGMIGAQLGEERERRLGVDLLREVEARVRPPRRDERHEATDRGQIAYELSVGSAAEHGEGILSGRPGVGVSTR